MKICLVCSAGGHLMQLFMIKKFWARHDRFWVTENKVDANSMLFEEKIIYGNFPTTRNLINLIKNAKLAIKVLFREKPDLIISNGAGIAVPFFYLGKLFGKKTIYIEVIDRISTKTLTGKLVKPVSDKFIVQWDSQQEMYDGSINLGTII